MSPSVSLLGVFLFVIIISFVSAGPQEDAACIGALISEGCDPENIAVCQGGCLSTLQGDLNCADMYSAANCECRTECFDPTEEEPLPGKAEICSDVCKARWETCLPLWPTTSSAEELNTCCNQINEENWEMCSAFGANSPHNAGSMAPTMAGGSGSPVGEPIGGAGTCTQECFNQEAIDPFAIAMPCLDFLTQQTLTIACLEVALPPEEFSCSAACQHVLADCNDIWVPYIDIVQGDGDWQECCNAAEGWANCLFSLWQGASAEPSTPAFESPTIAPSPTMTPTSPSPTISTSPSNSNIDTSNPVQANNSPGTSTPSSSATSHGFNFGVSTILFLICAQYFFTG